MDEQPVKIAKITIRVDYADGSAIEAQAREPRDLGVDFAYPEPEFDLLPRHFPGAGASRDVTYVSLQPPPTITVRFTVSSDHGLQERYLTRAENEQRRGEPDLPT